MGLLVPLLVAAPAGAHPLGNFTTNVHLGLLGAFGQGEPIIGLALVGALGMGMSAALVSAGLAAVGAVRGGWRMIGSTTIRHRLEHLVPGLAAVAVTAVGVALLWQVAATWS